MADNLIGTMLLDRFRVDTLIALSKASKIYRVWDLEKDTPLAMKVFNTNANNGPMPIERFDWEL